MKYEPDPRITLTAISILLMLICFCVETKAQSNTCSNGDALVVNTGGDKNNQCIPLGQQPAGTGTTMIIANASATGTTVNKFAKLTGAPSTAVISSNGDTENAIGVVTAGAGTTGNATITILGQVSCVFDGATTAGNYVTIAATGGGCHDAGSTYPVAGAAYGRVLSTNGGAGTYVMELMTPDIAFQNAGNGKSKPGTPNLAYQYNNSNVFTGGILSQSSSTRIALGTAGDSFQFGGGAILTGTTLELALTSANFKTGNVFSGSTYYLGGNAGNQNGGLQFSNSNQLMWASGNVTGGGLAISASIGRDAAGIVESNNGTLTQLGSPSDARDWKGRKYLASGAAPTIASGFGTSPSIAGRDEAFRVTAGTTPGTGGVVTFGTAYSIAPICVATDETTTTVILNTTPTTTNVTITVAAGVLLLSDKIGVLCQGYLNN